MAEIFPLVCDCMTLREIRAYVDVKTAWGRTISDAQLKRYLAEARRQMREAADFDREQEFGAARRRLERIIARAAAKGDPRTQLTANRQLGELLGLAGPARLELGGPGGGPIAVADTAEEIRERFERKIASMAAALRAEEAPGESG